MILEPIPTYTSSTESIREQLPAIKIEDGQIQHLKPSLLPLMNQVNLNRIFVYIYIHKFSCLD